MPIYHEDPASDSETQRVVVVISRFTIANDMVAQVREAFQSRPHLVDQAPGFLRMEVMSPIDKPEEIWLVTHWENETSFHVWHESHAYRESHKGIPKGLKLVPKATEIRQFEVFAT
jgi:heme-degrading monooxygenase HmoA